MSGGASWKHDQDLSFKNVRTVLESAKSALEKAIDVEKQNLSRMIGARDGIRK